MTWVAAPVPQEKSYWALALPHGWWLFGLDLALSDDIDICQCRHELVICITLQGVGQVPRTMEPVGQPARLVRHQHRLVGRAHALVGAPRKVSE